MRYKNSAFTLAEVLITLGVIGIVAAMTLPTLVAKYQDRVLLNQAKRSYSIISNAMMKAKADYNFDSYGDLFNKNNYTNAEIIEILAKELKPIKTCPKGGKCWTWKTLAAKKYYSNGKTAYFTLSGYPSMVLADGSVIYIGVYDHDGNCYSAYNGYKQDGKGNPILDEDGNKIYYTSHDYRCGSIKIDVNGEKGPNQFGADTWDISVKKNAVTLEYYSVLYDDTLTYEYYQEGVE